MRKQAEMRNMASKYALPERQVQQSLQDMPAFADEIQANAPESDLGKHSRKMRKAGASIQMKAKW